MRRDPGRPIRVLHAPADVGGHPQGLARAERELGLDSRTIVFEPGPFGYAADETVLPPRPGLADRARLEAFRFRLLRRAMREADVVHLNFGQSLFPRPIVPGSPAVAGFPRPLQQAYRAWAAVLGMRDLALLRRAGVAVFVTFQGDDVRQGDVARAAGRLYPPPGELPAAVERGMDQARRTVVRRFDRHADGLFHLNPDLRHVLPARSRFTPYAHVDPRDWQPAPRPARERPLVVHAPSSRAAKGTAHVLAALDALRAEGVAFDLELVEGMPQAQARAVYARADLVVDQLLIGWYGGLAVECMALGVPVVAHIAADDLAGVPAEMARELPIVDATPATVRDVLRDLLTARRAELPELGRRARAFAERWHDPRRVAADVIACYEQALDHRAGAGPSGSVPGGAGRAGRSAAAR